MKLNTKSISCVILAALVAGCSAISAQFKKAEEGRDDEPRARLRIIADSWVKAIPDRDCTDWSAPGTGTVWGGIFGSRGYRDKSRNMPFPPVLGKQADMAEMYIAAERYITLCYVKDLDKYGNCGTCGSFFPKEGKDYEIVFEPCYSSSSQYNVALYEILDERKVPIKISRAENCQE